MESVTSQPLIRTRPTVEQHIKAKADYVQGRGTIRSISNKYGISYGTVRNWHQAEHWHKLRTAYVEKLNRDMDRATAPAQQEPVKPPVEPGTQGAKLGTVEEQLVQVDVLLKSCHDGKEFNSLSQAKERLLNMWSLLTGFPKPGTRRTKAQSQPSPMAGIQPRPAP